MIYPPLPQPEIIDGRRLYTAGQMREYAKTCAGLATVSPATNTQKVKANDAKVFGEYSAAVDDLMKSMGMKK